MDAINVKTRFKNHKPRTFAFQTTGESLTQQQFKQECDINNILSKYQKTGIITYTNGKTPFFDDFSNVPDYHTALTKLNYIQESFEALPSSLRRKFNNKPGGLIDYLNDPKNTEEAIKLGLLVRKTETPKTEPPKTETPKEGMG